MGPMPPIVTGILCWPVKPRVGILGMEESPTPATKGNRSSSHLEDSKGLGGHLRQHYLFVKLLGVRDEPDRGAAMQLI